MTVTALVQRMNQHWYRAATTHPVALEVEAASREEALSDLRALASGWLSDTEVVELELPEQGQSNPWVQFAGAWRQNPYLPEYLESLAEYRATANQTGLQP